MGRGGACASTTVSHRLQLNLGRTWWDDLEALRPYSSTSETSSPNSRREPPQPGQQLASGRCVSTSRGDAPAANDARGASARSRSAHETTEAPQALLRRGTSPAPQAAVPVARLGERASRSSHRRASVAACRAATSGERSHLHTRKAVRAVSAPAFTASRSRSCSSQAGLRA